VHAGERVAGVFQVVKPSAHPGIHGVAGLAGGGKVARDVVNDRSLKVFLMAGVTCRREALKLATGRALVALVALNQRMGTYERKAIVMLIDCIQRNIPTFHCVAAFAVCAELAAMNIGMAIRTARADIFEDKLCMALRAGYLLMHAAQWIACLVVIEFWVRPDGLPTGVSMTVLAGRSDGAVRIGDLGLRATHTWPRIGWRLL